MSDTAARFRQAPPEQTGKAVFLPGNDVDELRQSMVTGEPIHTSPADLEDTKRSTGAGAGLAIALWLVALAAFGVIVGPPVAHFVRMIGGWL